MFTFSGKNTNNFNLFWSEKQRNAKYKQVSYQQQLEDLYKGYTEKHKLQLNGHNNI